MKGVTETSVLTEGCVILSLLSNVMYLISLISVGWALPTDDPSNDNTEYEGVGLWKVCKKENDNAGLTVCLSLIGNFKLPDWFTATQILITTSMAGLGVSFFILIGHTCIERFQKQRCFLLVYTVVAFIFSLLGLTGIIMFGVDVQKDLFNDVALKVYWSYVVAAVSIGLQFLCVTLSTVEMIFRPCRSPSSVTDKEQILRNAAEMAETSTISRESTT